MYARTTLINGNYYYTNNQNYLYTYLRFKTLFLLFKTTYPEFAFKIIITLKNIHPNISYRLKLVI